MPTGHAVDTANVAHGSGLAATLAEQGQTTATEMITRLNAVIWKGAGGSAFLAKCEEMRNDLTRINNSLGWLSNRLGTAGVDYDSADVEGEQMVRNSTANMGGIGTALRQA